MDSFYVTNDEFWNWFNRSTDPTQPEPERILHSKIRPAASLPDDRSSTACKRQKTDTRPRIIDETEAATGCDSRYIILYGRHKPGKKSKVWEGDGYLSLVGQVAHLCDLRGRILEEPTLLDVVDYNIVKDLGELTIGNTEVQVIEPDK